MVTANLVAATLVPICCLFLLLRVSLPRWRTAGEILLVAALAAVATLAILAQTNQQLGGRWFFLQPSVIYASTRMWLPSPWDVQAVSWLSGAHFLVLQAWRHASPRHRDALTPELAMLAVLIAAHVLVFRLGNLSWDAASRVLVAALPDAQPISAISAFAVCGVALLLFRFERSPWLRWPAYSLALWIAYGSIPASWITADTPHVKEDYAITVSAHRYLWEHLDNNRRLTMWYALPPNEKRPFRSIASTYLWVWALVNENLPTLSASEADSLTPNAQLVLLVPDLRDTDVVKGVLRKFDFDYTPREQMQFGPAAASF